MGKKGNYYTQIVKLSHSDEWLYKIFAMEVVHMWDDMVWAETSIDLDRVFGVDYDKDLVHEEREDGSYATDYIYTELIKLVAPYANAALQRRRDEYETHREGLLRKLSILEKLLELYKTLIRLRRSQPTPITYEELKGEHNHSHH